MKTAISIPDDLFDAAERLAEQQGVSRSEFYARAIRQYVEARSGAQITESFNRLAESVDTSLPPEVRRATVERLRKVEW